MSENVEILIMALNRTDEDIRGLRREIDGLRKDIKDLNAFKWRVYGIASIISIGIALIGILIK